MPPLRLLLLVVAAALLVPAACGAELVVAASDASASDRAAADLVCDGVDDQSQINAAFNLLPGEAGTVRLTAGTFRCSGSIFPNGNCELVGAGQGATRIVVLNAADPNKPISVTQPYVLLQGFTLMGNGGVMVRVSHVTVQEVTATNRGPDEALCAAGTNGLFYIWVDGGTVEDVAFIDCTAYDAHTHGFSMNGINKPKLTRNIRFTNCVARSCGYGAAAGSRSDWITGFDLQEENDVDGLQLVNCRAEDNWQSGFHFEPGADIGTIKKKITLTGCTAERNGQRNPAAYPYTSTFLSGFYVHFNTVLTDCVSIDNKNAGFYVEGGDNVLFSRCTDTGSCYGWKVVKNARNIRLEDCQSSGAEKWAFWSAYATNIQLVRFVQTDAAGDRGYQSMLGWYYDNPSYQYPVTSSSFEITASGNPSLGIINQEGSGNTYSLSREGSGGPVSADFVATPVSGDAPLSVRFTDASTGSPTSWAWDFGDGASSGEQNPSHTYNITGTYTVALTASNAAGQNTRTLTDLISVGAPPLSVTSITPSTGAQGATVTITNLAGTGFVSGATVALRLTGSSDIQATNVAVKSPTQITCEFMLPANGAAGPWSVAVTNPDGTGASLAAGFRVTTAADTTPPGAITKLTATARAATSITWNWTDPADADFAGVRISLNGADKGSVPKGVQHYTATGLAPSTAYRISIVTVDSAGNANPSAVSDRVKTLSGNGAAAPKAPTAAVVAEPATTATAVSTVT